MIAYAESSAVLAWLFGEPRGEEVRRILEAADGVVTSRLTRLECLRALIRVEAGGVRSRDDTDRVRDVLASASAEWMVIDPAPEVLDRAGTRFPAEPVRSLDAVHLATMLVAHDVAPELEMVSLDERVRRNAEELGVTVRPAS